MLPQRGKIKTNQPKKKKIKKVTGRNFVYVQNYITMVNGQARDDFYPAKQHQPGDQELGKC